MPRSARLAIASPRTCPKGLGRHVPRTAVDLLSTVEPLAAPGFSPTHDPVILSQ